MIIISYYPFKQKFSWSKRNFKETFLLHTQNKCQYRELFCLFDLILYVQSTIFQLKRDGSFWVEPFLSWDKCVLLKDHNTVTPVRLEPATLLSRVKHSTTEPLRSLIELLK